MTKQITLFSVVILLTCIIGYALAGDGHKQFSITDQEKVVALTILAEARGEGERGMYAVAAVIAQRAHEKKMSPKEICLKRKQFSCWNNKTVKDLEHLFKTKQSKYALTLARNVMHLSREFTGFANHYHNNKVTPYWSKGVKPTKVIGNHIFYKL
tara:strand:+ start:81 stop:545 length:465 start_codon:yes stop_codon:yes gene_type:complete